MKNVGKNGFESVSLSLGAAKIFYVFDLWYFCISDVEGTKLVLSQFFAIFTSYTRKKRWKIITNQAREELVFFCKFSYVWKSPKQIKSSRKWVTMTMLRKCAASASYLFRQEHSSIIYGMFWPNWRKMSLHCIHFQHIRKISTPAHLHTAHIGEGRETKSGNMARKFSYWNMNL